MGNKNAPEKKLQTGLADQNALEQEYKPAF
jgi:hypothetical protein